MKNAHNRNESVAGVGGHSDFTNARKGSPRLFETTRFTSGGEPRAKIEVDSNLFWGLCKPVLRSMYSFFSFSDEEQARGAVIHEIACAYVWIEEFTLFAPRINRMATVRQMARRASIATDEPVSPLSMAIASRMACLWTKSDPLTPASAFGVKFLPSSGVGFMEVVLTGYTTLNGLKGARND